MRIDTAATFGDPTRIRSCGEASQLQVRNGPQAAIEGQGYLSPFDSWAWAAFDAQAMSHLLRGRYEEACRAAYKSVQANPAHSITYVQLAAALAKLGRLGEARAAAARVVELQPAFRYSRHFAGVKCAPALAEVLGGALREAGLPE